jgi:hypothetical protein
LPRSLEPRLDLPRFRLLALLFQAPRETVESPTVFRQFRQVFAEDCFRLGESPGGHQRRAEGVAARFGSEIFFGASPAVIRDSSDKGYR